MAAAAGLGVALAAAAVLMVNALRLGLTRGLDDQARQAAQQVAALVAEDRLPDPVPVGSGAVTIQVLSASGQITDVSPGGDRLVPLLSPAAAAGGRAQMLAGGPFGMAPLLRVVAVPVAGGGVVVAAIAYSSVQDSITVMTWVLAAGMPLLLALLAVAVWLVTGSLLRPIGELRRGAAELTGSGVPRALPVPAARDEVRALADTLNDLLARLAAAQQRQRDLVSDTAHELRNPIASIRAQLEVALDHPDTQDWAETARDVHADTLRLARLAEDLLLLARLDERAAGPGPPSGTPVTDMTAVCRESAARYLTARVPVRFRGNGAEVPVRADAEAIRRVAVNLLDNAVRYAASSVTITACLGDGHAVLTVTDDGPGIPVEDAERAFGRFTRLDPGPGGGAGLGLAIARATAEVHGGTVALYPAAPGLRAVVTLPAAAGKDRGQLARSGRANCPQ
jgi:signal transduction histidine kinase